MSEAFEIDELDKYDGKPVIIHFKKDDAEYRMIGFFSKNEGVCQLFSACHNGVFYNAIDAFSVDEIIKVVELIDFDGCETKNEEFYDLDITSREVPTAQEILDDATKEEFGE
jgi:hypothetical protein